MVQTGPSQAGPPTVTRQGPALPVQSRGPWEPSTLEKWKEAGWLVGGGANGRDSRGAGLVGVARGPHGAQCWAVVFRAGTHIPTGPEGAEGAKGGAVGSRGPLGNSAGPALRWELGCESACGRVWLHVRPQVPRCQSMACLWPGYTRRPQSHRTMWSRRMATEPRPRLARVAVPTGWGALSAQTGDSPGRVVGGAFSTSGSPGSFLRSRTGHLGHLGSVMGKEGAFGSVSVRGQLWAGVGGTRRQRIRWAGTWWGAQAGGCAAQGPPAPQVVLWPDLSLGSLAPTAGHGQRAGGLPDPGQREARRQLRPLGCPLPAPARSAAPPGPAFGAPGP